MNSMAPQELAMYFKEDKHSRFLLKGEYVRYIIIRKVNW